METNVDDNGASRAVRRQRIVAVVFLAIVALGAAALTYANTYQPLTRGSFSGRDDHLLIGTRPLDSVGEEVNGGTEGSILEYRFRAGTSYYTAASVRNEGPFAVTILGIDAREAIPMSPSVDPVELRVPSPDVDPSGTDWASSAPFAEFLLEPDAERMLWIRWVIGPCAVGEPAPHEQGSAVARSSLPLRWSFFGMSSTITIELGYTIAFEVNTPEDLATQCVPATRSSQS